MGCETEPYLQHNIASTLLNHGLISQVPSNGKEVADAVQRYAWILFCGNMNM